MNNTFLNIIHKQNCDTNELYNCSFKNTTEFFNTAYNYEFRENKQQIINKLSVYIFVTNSNQVSETRQYLKFKYSFLQNVFINQLIDAKLKMEFVELFNKAQIVYNTLNRFVYHLKLKKYPIHISCDLYLTPINESDSNVITILQNRQRYLFTLNDIVSIFETALSNSYGFDDVKPLIPKNPYNNIEFNFTDFHNIYFFLKKTMTEIPMIIQSFYKFYFNIRRFRSNCENIIRFVYIRRTLNNYNDDILRTHIDRMLDSYKNVVKFRIDAAFPNERIIEIMKPYVHLYLLSKHAYYSSTKAFSNRMLQSKLINLYNHNPIFGRKMYKTKDNKIHSMYFSDDSLEFNSIMEIDYFTQYKFLYLTNGYQENNNPRRNTSFIDLYHQYSRGEALNDLANQYRNMQLEESDTDDSEIFSDTDNDESEEIASYS